MNNIIIDNIPSIIIVIIIISVLCILYKYNKKELVKSITLSLVVRAEKFLGSGTGELKYAYVVEEVYNRLPKILRLLYNMHDIDQFIESGVQKLKEVLSKDNVTLHGYDEETYLETIDNIG